MQQDNYRDLIPFYVARTLTPAQQREFEAQLAASETLRQEVEEWRVIAAAVWREADSVARRVPPLSPEIYARLAYRGTAPQMTYAPAGPAEVTVKQPRVRTGRTFPVPLTLVAGLVLAILFGGILVMVAINNGNRPQPLTIAEAPSGTPVEATFGAPGIFTSTPLPFNTESGIIPVSPGVLVPPTDTLSPVPSPVNPAVDVTATPAPLLPEGTQRMMLNVAPPVVPPGECAVRNESAVPVNVYISARRDTALVAQILPGETYPALVRTADFWYEVFFEPGRVGWVNSVEIVAYGACESLMLPSATPAATATVYPLVLTVPPGAEIAIVAAPFADLRSGPGTGYRVVYTAARDTQFVVRGYTGEGDFLWIFTVLPDGQDAWLPGTVVRILPMWQITPPVTATPTPAQ